MTETQEEVEAQLVLRYLFGDFNELGNFRYAVIKSYVPEKRPEKIEDIPEIFERNLLNSAKVLWATLEDIRIFFKTYIGEDFVVHEKYELKRSLADFISKKLPTFIGDQLYLPEDFINRVNGRQSHFITSLKHADYVQNRMLPSFFTLKEKQNVVLKESMQPYFLQMYLEISSKYVSRVSCYVKDLSSAQFAKFCNSILNCLDSFEAHMLESSKQDAKFVKAKERVDWFKHNYMEVHSIYSKGDLFYTVNNAVSKIKCHKATASDKQAVAYFLDKADYLNQALLPQKDGKVYPANCFACMPVHLSEILGLISRVLSIFGQNAEEKDILNKSYRLICQTFPFEKRQAQTIGYSAQNIIEQHKNMRITTSEGLTIDLSGDMWALYKRAIDDTIKKYNLPKYKACMEAVCYALARGKNPINLPAKEAKKQKVAIKQ